MGKAGKLALCVLPLLFAAQSWAFDLDDVAVKAKALAAEGYSAPQSRLPASLRELPFAGYQKVRFLEEKAHWRDDKLPFQLYFFHQGMHFDLPVKINEVTAKGTREIKYDPAMFDFSDLQINRDELKDLGFAGFKVIHQLNDVGKHDELMSVLGASYFRIVGKGQVFGLSARGLAIAAMAVFHFAWDLEFFGYAPVGMTRETGWMLFARAIASSFLFLVGVSLFLAHGGGLRRASFLKRFAMVAGAAAEHSKVMSKIPLFSQKASSRSGSLTTFMVSSAPMRRATSSAASCRSVTTTRAAPAWRSAPTTSAPIGPAPVTRTDLPARLPADAPARLSACRHTASGSAQAASPSVTSGFSTFTH